VHFEDCWVDRCQDAVEDSSDETGLSISIFPQIYLRRSPYILDALELSIQEVNTEWNLL
jgi:hypothetical protein